MEVDCGAAIKVPRLVGSRAGGRYDGTSTVAPSRRAEGAPPGTVQTESAQPRVRTLEAADCAAAATASRLAPLAAVNPATCPADWGHRLSRR